MSTRLLSSTLQDAADRLLDVDASTVPLGLDELVAALEHAAVLAAEHEHAAAHGVVRSDFGHHGEPAYPPLVDLLGKAAAAYEPPVIVPVLVPDETLGGAL